MAEEPEKSGQEPNLELPSLLGFARRKKRKGESVQNEPTAEEVVLPEPATEEVHADSDQRVADPVAEPRGGLAPAAEKPKRLPPVPPPTRAGVATGQPPPQPPPIVPADELVEEAAAPEEPVVVETTPPTEQTIVLPGGPAPEEPPVQFVAPVYGEQSPSAEEPISGTVPGLAGQPTVEVAEEHAEVPTPARRSRSVSLPVINTRVAAFITGAFIGFGGVVLAFFAGRGCEAVRGVGSCGGIGLFALLAILALEVVLGAAMLKAWRVYDPVSTSFLGVGLVAVFVLLFLLSSLESIAMILVIPVLSGLTFTLASWVTTAFVEDTSSG